MAPTKETAATEVDQAGRTTLTIREKDLIFASFFAMKNKPELDFEKLAEHADYKSVGGARNAWYALMKKIDPDGTLKKGKAEAEGGRSTSVAPKKTPTKKQVYIKEEDSYENAALPETLLSTPGANDLDDNEEFTFPDVFPGKNVTPKRSAATANIAFSPASTKRGRKPKQPTYDDDGNVVETPKRSRAKKLDENGEPVTPKRRPRAKKDAAGNLVDKGPATAEAMNAGYGDVMNVDDLNGIADFPFPASSPNAVDELARSPMAEAYVAHGPATPIA